MEFIGPAILILLIFGPFLLLQYWGFTKKIAMKREEWVRSWGELAGVAIVMLGAFHNPPSQPLINMGTAVFFVSIAGYRVYLNWKNDAREVRIAYCGQVVAAVAAVLAWKYPALFGGRRIWGAVSVFALSGTGWLLAWYLWNRHGRTGGEKAKWQGRLYLGLFLLSTALAITVAALFSDSSWPMALFFVPIGLLIAHWAVPASIRRREKKKPNVEESRA